MVFVWKIIHNVCLGSAAVWSNQEDQSGSARLLSVRNLPSEDHARRVDSGRLRKIGLAYFTEGL